MAHIGIAAGTGIAAAAVVGATAGWRFSFAAGWIATATVYLIWVWASIAEMTATAIEVIVQQRHPARRPADLIILIASVASLGGVAHLLIAGSAKGPDATVAAAVGFLSVIASWLVVHAVYTVRYAILYYSEPVGGIDFNEKPTAGIDSNDDRAGPRYSDFAYVAYAVGMSFAISGTNLTSWRMRRTALGHGLLSYLFGSVILASVVNLIASGL